jgi:hypothetical protein
VALRFESLSQDGSFRSRGRLFTPRQIEIISSIVERHFDEGRTKISQRVCRTLRWRQANGRLKEVACREVLLKMEMAGLIRLPPRLCHGAIWKSPSLLETYKGDTTLLTSLDFRTVHLDNVRQKEQADLWNSLVNTYHYLHSSRIVGRQIKYLAYAGARPIACLGWGEAAWTLKARDEWIGWTPTQMTRHRHLMINNVRFLILPWIRVPNLASHLIAKCSEAVLNDWEASSGFRPVLLETFVDIQRFSGTCYRASNWIELGVTAGYAKVGGSHHNSQMPKAIFVYPTSKDCRKILRKGYK